MFNKEDILARLREGATVEDIADELTKTLNAASKDYDAERQKQKDAELAQKLKREYAGDVLSMVADYCKEYCPNLAKLFEDEEEDWDELTEDMVEIFDTLNKSVDTFKDMFKFTKDNDNRGLKLSFNTKDNDDLKRIIDSFWF